MKPFLTACQRLTIAGFFLLLTCSCGTNAQSLKTERQVCFLKHYTHLTDVVMDLDITLDLPVSGSPWLVDSITAYFNEKLYQFFDNGDKKLFPYESVYSTDLQHLAEHYRELYRPYFLEDSTWVHEFSTDCLMLRLVAQTDTYVTYEEDWIFYGEGDEVANNWVTFVKEDGHRLKEVISNDNMLRFFEDHHNLIDEGVWDEIQWDLSRGYDVWVVCSVGLLNDTVAHQYVYAPGIYEDLKYPMEMIRPYLSKEARRLVRL